MVVAGDTLQVKEVHAFDTYLQGEYNAGCYEWPTMAHRI